MLSIFQEDQKWSSVLNKAASFEGSFPTLPEQHVVTQWFAELSCFHRKVLCTIVVVAVVIPKNYDHFQAY